MYNTLCLISSIKIKLVIYCIWLVSFHQSAHILYQFLVFFYFSFFYSKFCSKVYLIVSHAAASSTSFFNYLGILFLLAFSNQLQQKMDKLVCQGALLLLHDVHNLFFNIGMNNIIILASNTYNQNYYHYFKWNEMTSKKIQKKSLDSSPDETRTFEKGKIEIANLGGDVTIGRGV